MSIFPTLLTLRGCSFSSASPGQQSPPLPPPSLRLPCRLLCSSFVFSNSPTFGTLQSLASIITVGSPELQKGEEGESSTYSPCKSFPDPHLDGEKCQKQLRGDWIELLRTKGQRGSAVGLQIASGSRRAGAGTGRAAPGGGSLGLLQLPPPLNGNCHTDQ